MTLLVRPSGGFVNLNIVREDMAIGSSGCECEELVEKDEMERGRKRIVRRNNGERRVSN